MKRRTKAYKIEGQKFMAGVTAMLKEFGAEYTPDRFYEWRLWTPIGWLLISPSENYTTGPGCLFCRWDDYKRAATLCGSNPYSGKWNYCCFHGTAEIALQDVRRIFERAQAMGAKIDVDTAGKML